MMCTVNAVYCLLVNNSNGNRERKRAARKASWLRLLITKGKENLRQVWPSGSASLSVTKVVWLSINILLLLLLLLLSLLLLIFALFLKWLLWSLIG